MLNERLLQDSNWLSQGLRQPFLVIENALQQDKAEALYRELEAFENWESESENSFQGKAREQLEKLSPQYTYRRRSIDLLSAQAPPTLQALKDYLLKESTLAWMSDVSGRRCDSFNGRAVLYGNGDYIAEHNDYYNKELADGSVISRSVTFNYYLTRDWREEWGGRFVWKNPYREIIPSFNTLVMFLVGPQSHHWVEPISEDAYGKRFAITGWFTAARKKEESRKKLNLKLG